MKLDTEALCPWCNAAPSEWKADGMFAAGCANKTSCNVQPHAIAPDQVTARVLWNRRAALPQSQDIRALVEELRAAREAARYVPGDHPVVPVKLNNFMVEVDAFLDRALSCLAGEGWRPKVKPLVWEALTAARSAEDPTREETGDYEAVTPFGCYSIQQYFGSDSYGWQVTFDFNIVADKDDPEDAKAAAQADYDRRILSALDLPAPSVEEKLP